MVVKSSIPCSLGWFIGFGHGGSWCHPHHTRGRGNVPPDDVGIVVPATGTEPDVMDFGCHLYSFNHARLHNRDSSIYTTYTVYN